MSEMQVPKIYQAPISRMGRITLILMIINIALFAWQILTGVDVTNPATVDALKWGADYAPLTYSAEPWRLFSSMFFHFGLVHLMLNMWALYLFGKVAEQSFGWLYYLGVYVLAGLMGSLLSGYVDLRNTFELIQTFDQSLFPHVSAGASGAVMGLGGALAALSCFKPLPQQQYILDRKSLLMILALNIGMGFMVAGINNAAHIGGMLMGAALALIWYLLQLKNIQIMGQIVVLILGALSCYLCYRYMLILIQPIEPLWLEMLAQMKTQLHF